MEQKQKMEEERLAKLEAIAAKQRQRELEIEEKQARQSAAPSSGAYRVGGTGGSGGWREREAAKKDSWKKKG